MTLFPFIPLKSIGCYLGGDNSFYPMMNDGSVDMFNPTPCLEVELESIVNLSDDDRLVLITYLSDSEQIYLGLKPTPE